MCLLGRTESMAHLPSPVVRCACAQSLGFGLNALAFEAMALYLALPTTPKGPSIVATLLCVTRAVSRFGATTATFVMPAASFAHDVRLSYTGIAAACGKASTTTGLAWGVPSCYLLLGRRLEINFPLSVECSLPVLLDSRLVPFLRPH